MRPPLLAVALLTSCTGTSAGPGTSMTQSGAGGQHVGDTSSVSLPDPPGDLLPEQMLTRDSACVEESTLALPTPTVLQFVVDTSQSMADPAPGIAASKWQVTRDVLRQAVERMPPQTAVGTVYFPDQDTEPNGPCFSWQVAVALGTLGSQDSEQRVRLAQSMGDVEPIGGTPTHDAYLFALERLQISALTGNKHMVLITDGTPTFLLGCEGTGYVDDPVDPSPLIADARAAWEGGISTFVVGSPGSSHARSWLSRMARLSGTAKPGCSDDGPEYCHFDMTPVDELRTALARALEEIVGQTLSCTYRIPELPSGNAVDAEQLNVMFRSGDGTEEIVLKDPSATQCNTGWNYTADETELLLCGETCDRVLRDPSNSVELLIGCDTRVGIR